MAVARDYDEALGVTLHIRVPSDSTDAVKLLVAGRADFAILDIHDLAIAREHGRDLVGVMALVQTPLAAILAQPSIRTPRDLEGQRVGVTGLPSDDAVLRSIVAGAGGDPEKVRATTIGFGAVPGAAGGPRGGRDRVLERRGRRAAGQAAGDPRVPRRRLRRAGLSRARAHRDPRRRCRTRRRSCARRSRRCRAATPRCSPIPRAASARSSRPCPASTQDERPARARRRLPVLPRRRAGVRRAEPVAAARLGRVGAEVRDRQAAARRRPGVRRALRAARRARLTLGASRPAASAAPSRAITTARGCA